MNGSRNISIQQRGHDISIEFFPIKAHPELLKYMMAWGSVGGLIFLLPSVIDLMISRQNDGTLFVLGGIILIPEIIASVFLVGGYFTREYLTITPHAMKLGTITGMLRRETTYHIDRIRNIRLIPSPRRARGTLCFDYPSPKKISGLRHWLGYQPIRAIKFGKRLHEEEAHMVLNAMTDILNFRCHCVERIIFGVVPYVPEQGIADLHNPDVSSLTVPFWRLHQIMIDTNTYNFHLVEQFLTYAVNSIGQDYLKKYVTAHVYGKMENFHPNLWNSLTNLCQQVLAHTYEELSHAAGNNEK